MSGPASPRILVVDDEVEILDILKEILEDEGYEVASAENAKSARELHRQRRPDLVLLDIWMPGTDGISLLKEWFENGARDIPVVMMSGHGTIETAVEATRSGAYDFLEKPLSTAKLLLTVRRALETANLRKTNIELRHQATPAPSDLIGNSAALENLRAQVRRIAEHDAPVFISGEPGSGKEMTARYLHIHSPRADGPFVRLHVAGLIGHAGSIDIFGAEEGSHIHYGALERAAGGTLLLEDIADMEPELQARLVSAMRQGSFLRHNGLSAVPLTSRIVAAGRNELAHGLACGSLREDLYHLLDVFPLSVPPLRDHREDIPALIAHCIDTLVTRDNLPNRRLTVGAQNRLRNHPWPGNIRELVNVLQRLLILGNGSVIEQNEVEMALGHSAGEGEEGESLLGVDLPLSEARELFERIYLENHLIRAEGNMAKVATSSGLERTHLYRKLRRLGIDPKRIAGAAKKATPASPGGTGSR